MTKINNKCSLLIVEDNEGDLVLIREYLKDEMPGAKITHAKNYKEASAFFNPPVAFDAILLDLSLPDLSGEELVAGMLVMAASIPVIVLTGLADKNFGMTSLSMGVTDYLLKDELNASLLCKAISYSIERKRINASLKNSTEKYRNLFQMSPSPMYAYDVLSLKFLSVNEAAIRHYGYSEEEFLSLTIRDIRPADQQELNDFPEKRADTKTFHHDVAVHVKKNGVCIDVDIQSSIIDFEGSEARLVLVTDITNKLKAENDLRLSEKRFRSLVHEGSDLIAIVDEHGFFQPASPKGNVTFGYGSRDFIHRDAFEFIHPDDVKKTREEFASIAFIKRIQLSPFRFRTKDGEYRWMETIATNLMDEPAVNGVVLNSKDITIRMQAEHILLETINRYDAVATATSDAIWDFDVTTEKLYIAGGGFKTMFGYKLENEYLDNDFVKSKIHPEDIQRLSEAFFKATTDPLKKQWSVEFRFLSADNSYAHVLNRFSVLFSKGTPVKMLGALQDITRRKEEEQHLKLLESVITNATDAVMITDATPLEEPGPRIIYVNEAFTKMTGYSKEEIIGKSPRFLQGPKTRKLDLDTLRRCLKQWQPCEIETINYKKNGQEYWVNITIAPVADNNGGYSHWIAIEKDVTHRKEEDHAITRAIISTQETERAELGRELHDNINQILAGSLLNLGMAKNMRGKEIYPMIDRVHGYIAEAIDETRRLSHRLAPATFDEDSMQNSFNSLLANMNADKKFDVEVDFDHFNASAVSIDIKLNLYRILQEQLSNIVKYSSAKKIMLKVSQSPDHINMTIKDDGKGFDITATRKGIGLNNIKKRVEYLWGQLNLDTGIGKGCEINVNIPLFK